MAIVRPSAFGQERKFTTEIAPP